MTHTHTKVAKWVNRGKVGWVQTAYMLGNLVLFFFILSASIKCPWYSIWLVASQPTRISAVMKSTFIQPRWLGRSFYSFFFFPSFFLDYQIHLFSLQQTLSGWLREHSSRTNWGGSQSTEKSWNHKRSSAMQAVWCCVRSHLSLVSHSTINGNLETEKESLAKKERGINR